MMERYSNDNENSLMFDSSFNQLQSINQEIEDSQKHKFENGDPDLEQLKVITPRAMKKKDLDALGEQIENRKKQINKNQK